MTKESRSGSGTPADATHSRADGSSSSLIKVGAWIGF
jgi:hypothetical protein